MSRSSYPRPDKNRDFSDYVLLKWFHYIDIVGSNSTSGGHCLLHMCCIPVRGDDYSKQIPSLLRHSTVSLGDKYIMMICPHGFAYILALPTNAVLLGHQQIQCWLQSNAWYVYIDRMISFEIAEVSWHFQCETPSTDFWTDCYPCTPPVIRETWLAQYGCRQYISNWAHLKPKSPCMQQGHFLISSGSQAK